jgi:hypothetical protein
MDPTPPFFLCFTLRRFRCYRFTAFKVTDTGPLPPFFLCFTLRRFCCYRFTAFKVCAFCLSGVTEVSGAPLWQALGALGRPWRDFWVSLGVSGRLFGMSLVSQVASCAPPGDHWESLGVSWGSLVAPWAALCISGCPLAFSWVSLWGCRGIPGRLLGAPGRSLGTFMTRLLDLAASPGTPPLSLSNSYHFGDFSASAASGSDSVIWPACVNPLLSLSESYHFGDFSASAASGSDSVIWPACVKPSLSLSASCHFGDFSASAAPGPDSSFGRPM